MTRALIPLADGVEEIEAVIVIDTLRRAEWDVVAAGIRPGPVTASRGVRLIPDAEWQKIDPASFDALILPGGARGTEELCRDVRVLETIRCLIAAGKIVGAICAAPLVLRSAGVLAGRRATCYPGLAAQLAGAKYLSDRVVVDGNLITSQGPGTAFEFALRLVEMRDPDRAREVASAMLVDV